MKSLVLAAVFALSVALNGAEPLYAGKPEHYWIDMLTNKNAKELLAPLGTDQATIVLKALTKKARQDSAVIRGNAEALLDDRNFPVGMIVTVAFDESDAELQHAASSVLARWLQHPNPSWRVFAAEALEACDGGCGRAWEAAYVALRKALSHKDSTIREAAAAALRGRALENIEEAFKIFAEEGYHAESLQEGNSWGTTIKVVTQNGEPIAGADVWLPWRQRREWESKNPMGSSAKWADSGQTDRNGVVTFTRLGFVGEANASKAGFAPASIRFKPLEPHQSGGPPSGQRMLPAMTISLKEERPDKK